MSKPCVRSFNMCMRISIDYTNITHIQKQRYISTQKKKETGIKLFNLFICKRIRLVSNQAFLFNTVYNTIYCHTITPLLNALLTHVLNRLLSIYTSKEVFVNVMCSIRSNRNRVFRYS